MYRPAEDGGVLPIQVAVNNGTFETNQQNKIYDSI
jgi:hypothetical protein